MARYYTAKQVADLCGMTRDGIHKARRRGKFPHTKKVTKVDGTSWHRFTRHDVREYLLFEHNVVLAEAE